MASSRAKLMVPVVAVLMLALVVPLVPYASAAVMNKKKGNKPPDVVTGLDIPKYMGLWYEIAKFPTIFESKDAYNVTAHYSLNENNTVTVVNSEFVGSQKQSITGLAYKADPNSDEAKLKVRFKVPPQFPIFTVIGNYWVLNVDKESYQWSLVGEGTRYFLWILARSNTISDSLYDYLVGYAESQGYDASRLRKTPQTVGDQPYAGAQLA